MSPPRKFSVVVPCFNDGKRIRRAVESGLAQTYPPHEIIIVDDGSNAATQKIIRDIAAEYTSRNVRAFFFEENQGVSIARNKGMNIASGDFICFLDSDDVWHSDKLKLVNEFLDHTGFPGAISHDFTYDVSDLNKRNYSAVNVSYKKITSLHLMLRNPITTPSLMIPAAFNIRFNEKMTHTEDHDFILRLSRITEIIFLKEKLVFIDRKLGSKGGLSGDTWQMRKGEIKMYMNLSGSHPKFFLLFPILLAYSFVKHIRSLILKRITS